MQDRIRAYLRDPKGAPRPAGDQDPHFAFLITYIGELFVQGYRLIENYGNILLLSLMQFQCSDAHIPKPSRQQRKLPARFKVLLWQMNQKQIFDLGKKRREHFGRMLSVGRMLQQVEYNIVYLHEHKYSVVGAGRMEVNAIPTCERYFLKIQWIQQKNGCRPIMEKEEGIELHKLAESFIKGAGQGRNPDLIRRLQGQNKFVYDLFKVVNTICYIIGKEILENDYQTISVEKWMRKFTEKKFKRYDLLMRSEHKCAIIDWKFTRLDAEEKIRGASTQKKNQAYYQLARKDYKTDVELKFYCFHERTVNQFYHCFTTARFDYQISTVVVEEERRGGGKEGRSGEKGEKGEKEEDYGFGEISIEDSVVDLVPDAPGQGVAVRDHAVIEVESSDGQGFIEQVGGSARFSYSSSVEDNRENSLRGSNLVENRVGVSKSQVLSVRRKQRMKQVKRALKQRNVYQIQSD